MKVMVTFVDEGYESVVELSVEQITKIVETADTIDKTFEEAIVRIVERGCYDVKYRNVHQKKQQAEFRAWRASKKS